MNGFKFSLEPVLSYHESLVDLLQIELVALEQKANGARSVRDRLIIEMDQNNADRRELLSRGQLDIAAVNRIEVYHESLSTRLKHQYVVVAGLETQVADKREELVRVQQDREILDELKRRQLRRFRQQLDHAEAELIDESAILGFNRRRLAAMWPRVQPTMATESSNDD